MALKLDAHQHFWQYNTEEFGWISDKMAVIRRDFLPKDLAEAQEPIGFDGAINVQARQSLEETRWLLEIARNEDRIKGIVGWVDLRSDGVADEIDEFNDNPKFVGVRHVVHDEPDDNFMLREDFLKGLAKLERYNLTYDLLLFPKHLSVAVEVVKKFPGIPFVLDHIAKPFIKDHTISPWKEDFEELASFENVTCKLSGMVTEADWDNWKPEDFTPYLDIALEAYGPDRLMIGSDWPVCLVAADYGKTMGLVTDYVAQLSADEQAAILGGTCAKFYGVE
jgi:L-fuconolactonase